MVITRAGAITAAAKAVSKSRENEKRRKPAANANQRSDKVRYGRPIGRGMKRGAHVCQRSDKVRYGRPI